MASKMPTVTFAGVKCNSGNFSLGWGITPSAGSVTLPVGVDFPHVEVGDLKFSDGGTSVVVRELYVDRAGYKASEDRWVVSLKDRRCKWKFGEITGEYNTGDTATGLIKRRANARALAQKLLDALGVRNYATFALPSRSYPPVTWEFANPADELQALCELYGCVVVLRPDGSVWLWRQGEGPYYSGKYWKEHDEGVEYPDLPGVVVVRGGRNVYQVEEPLEAVGEDIETGTDGTQSIVLKPLPELSYAPEPSEPDGGFGGQLSAFFSGVADKQKQTLALRSVFKTFRVTRFLPALADICETEDVKDDAGVVLRRERRKPYARGVVTRWDGSGKYVTLPSGEISTGFNFDRLTGVVRFQEVQYKTDETGTPRPAALDFVYAFAAGVPEVPLEADKFYTYTKRRRANYFSRVVHVEHEEDLVQHFFRSPGGKVTALKGEKKNLDKHARAIAEEILDARWEERSRASTYSGVVYAEPNGAVTSVAWSLSGGLPRTDVRWNTSQPPKGKPSYEEKLATVNTRRLKRSQQKKQKGEEGRTVVTEGRVQEQFGGSGGGAVYDAFSGCVQYEHDFVLVLADMRGTSGNPTTGTVTHYIHVFNLYGVEYVSSPFPMAVELEVGEMVMFTDWSQFGIFEDLHRYEVRVGSGCTGRDLGVMSTFDDYWNVFQRG